MYFLYTQNWRCSSVWIGSSRNEIEMVLKLLKFKHYAQESNYGDKQKKTYYRRLVVLNSRRMKIWTLLFELCTKYPLGTLQVIFCRVSQSLVRSERALYYVASPVSSTKGHSFLSNRNNSFTPAHSTSCPKRLQGMWWRSTAVPWRASFRQHGAGP